MKGYIFITQESAVLPIADRLQDENPDMSIVVGMIAKEDDPTTSNEKTERRLSLYDGILNKQPVEKVMSWMETIQNKDDWFVMVDYGSLWKYSKRALDMGFYKGVLPTEENYSFEKDRKKAKEFVEENYPGIRVAPMHEFKKVDDAVSFLQEEKGKIFVLKSEGSNAETVVPMTKDFDLARRQIIGALKTERADYERGGFSLEEKIVNAIEFSPVMVFWNGAPLFSLVELENKPLGSGNIGRLTGGCQNVCISTPLTCELNKIAFPPVVHEIAKKQKGVYIADAGLVFDGEDFCFLEFCGCRWGWDSIFSEISMSGDAEHKRATSNHFEMIAQGKNPIQHKYGASVRLFQTQIHPSAPDCYADGYAMDWLDEVSEQLFFYCIKKNTDKADKDVKFISVGSEKDLGVATGAGNTFDKAVDLAYKAASGFAMTGVYFRPSFDFKSTAYFTSIANRYKWLMESELIE